LNYQGDDDSFDVEYGTDGQALRIVYSGATTGWIPILDKTVADVPVTGNQNGIFGYGSTNVTNLVSNTGVVAANVTGVGTSRTNLKACEYGGDKGIFAYGGAYVSMSNLVSNAGVVATDVTGVGTARASLAACAYGGDKGIFGYGFTGSNTYNSMTNLVSNAGVIATDTSGVGTVRGYLAACEYGTDKAIFGYGASSDGVFVSLTDLVSIIKFCVKFLCHNFLIVRTCSHLFSSSTNASRIGCYYTSIRN